MRALRGGLKRARLVLRVIKHTRCDTVKLPGPPVRLSVPLRAGNGTAAPRLTVGGMVTIRRARDNGQPSATGARSPARTHACSSQTRWQWVPPGGLRYSRVPPKGGLLEDWPRPRPGEPAEARAHTLPAMVKGSPPRVEGWVLRVEQPHLILIFSTNTNCESMAYRKSLGQTGGVQSAV